MLLPMKRGGGGNRTRELNPEIRPRILRQIADALEGKSAKKRKSGKADDIAKIQAAYRRAKAKLKGLYRGDNPTRKQGEHEYGEILNTEVVCTEETRMTIARTA